MNRCLILYSTTDGHTKKICDYIAHNLDEVNKISVVNITSFNQKDLDNYDSIIIGASIRYGKHQNSLYKFINKNREKKKKKKNKLEVYKFKDKKFPHNKYFFFSEDSNVESVISDEFIELLSTGIKRKKALINIESNGKNLIFYKQWSRHSIEFMDFYSNLFKVLKESLIK